MNKVILMGNLTRDPEIRYSQGENSLAIARFGIAVNRRFARQGDTDTDFFNCTAFGRQANLWKNISAKVPYVDDRSYSERQLYQQQR